MSRAQVFFLLCEAVCYSGGGGAEICTIKCNAGNGGKSVLEPGHRKCG